MFQRNKGKEGLMSVRGDPHILIVGDPGLGKSQMLQAVAKVVSCCDVSSDASDNHCETGCTQRCLCVRKYYNYNRIDCYVS